MKLKLPLREGEQLTIEISGGSLLDRLRSMWRFLPLIIGSWSLTSDQVEEIFDKLGWDKEVIENGSS